MDELKLNRIMVLYEAGNRSLEKQDYRDACSRFRMITKEAEQYYREQEGTYYSFEHPIDVVLYRYYSGQEDFLEAELPMSRFYRKLGIAQIRLKDYDGALKSFDASSRWNPADADMLLRVAELHKRAGRPDSVRKCAEHAYSYCFTRAEMARYYRCFGFYYLERFQPETAACIYQYSMLFSPSQTADQELNFLYRAMNKERTELPTEELIERLTEAKLPLGPDDTTIGLIYQFGMQYYQSGQNQEALQCFSLVYDITADEETGRMIARLQMETPSEWTEAQENTEGAAD